MPLIYYGAGFLSGILAMVLLDMRVAYKKKKPEPWIQIDSLKFYADNEIEWDDRSITAYEIANSISKAFVNKASELNFEVQPGRYSVRVFVEAIFTKREKG